MSDSQGGGIAPPSWPAPVRRRWWQGLDIKIVIAVLIGLVSVTGAVLTWQASKFGESATDQDRLAVAQTVLKRQTETAVEAQLRDEQAAFEQFRQFTLDADLLRAQATDLEGQAAGDQPAESAAQLRALAVSARNEAARLASQADVLRFNGAFEGSAVKNEADTGLPESYDVEARKQSLFISDQRTPELDPEATARKGVEFRQKGQRLSGWAIPLVGAVVLLTFAQLSRKEIMRNVLVGLAMAVYVLSTAIAFAAG
jgi:hypothetical protein